MELFEISFGTEYLKLLLPKESSVYTFWNEEDTIWSDFQVILVKKLTVYKEEKVPFIWPSWKWIIS